MRSLFITLICCFPAGTVFAHEGHGHTDGYTIIHYLTEPVHAFAVGIAFVTGMAIWWRTRKKWIKK